MIRAGPVVGLLLALAYGAAPGLARAEPSADRLFAAPSLRTVVVSPSGRYLAALASAPGVSVVFVREVERGHPVLAFRDSREIREFAWVDGDDLIVTLGRDQGPEFCLVSIRMQDDELMTETKWIQSSGWLADALPGSEDTVLWAKFDGHRTAVYRVPVEQLLGDGHGPDRHWIVAEMDGVAPFWIADRHGDLRAALRSDLGPRPSWELLYRESAEEPWRSIQRSSDPEQARIPLGIASNDRDLVVRSNEGRDTAGLFELDVASGAVRELFAHPDFDVVGVRFDYSGTAVIAAVYREAGLPRYHYFDAFAARHQRALEAAFPGRSVSVTSESANGRYLALIASSARDPGTYYVLDTTTLEASEVGRVIEGLDPDELAEVEALRVPAPNGREIDAFFTHPRRPAGMPPPLVVLPHGGPIGVVDDRSFDPWVQLIAGAGLAVLQVNYRGSKGYGKAFLEAGRHEWAEGIEDDIDAAVDRVITEGWVNPERICIAGFSYGGYSALMGAIRSPQRYRCVASFAAPTDVPLLFQSSDFAETKEGREEFAKIVGDPERDRDHLLAISPVYRAGEIRVPVLLGHGSEDRRVTVEHAYRMHLMLEALGTPHEWFVVEGAEHSPSPEQAIQYANRLRPFLLRHLESGWRERP